MSARTGLLLAPVLAFLAVFFLGPVAGFLAQAATDREGALSLAPLLRLANESVYLEITWISIKIAFWVAVLSVLLGYPVAYVLACADPAKRSTWLLFVLLPFWSSFLVRTFAWIVILGREGPVNQLLLAAGIAERPQELLYSFGAVTAAMCNVLVPFAILTMLGVMESIDRSLVRAAGTLGARPVQAFFRIYLPLSMPGVAAAFLLVFITGLGFFMAPVLLGSARETMITQMIIQQVLELVNWPFAAVLCAVLLAAALVLFAVYDRVAGLSVLTGEGSTREGGAVARFAMRLANGAGDVFARLASALPLRSRASPSRAIRIVAAVIILFLIVPLVLLVPVSFADQSYVVWPPTGFTLKWYEEAISSPAWTGAAARTFVVALLTACVCFAVALPAAFAFRALRPRAARGMFALLLAPLIVPRLVIATALFWLFARIGLVGTTLGLVIGHTVIALPFVFITILAVMKTYDRRLDLAAASLGASPLKTVVRVTLPLIGTGLVSAFLFACIISLDELNVALFASGGLTATLPKLMWDEATLRFSPLLAAVSTFVLAVMSALALAAVMLSNRSQGK